MKTLVIGNGSSIREYKLGTEIDSYDVVVRFNRGYLEGIKGYEEYVGNKTDILIVHDGYAKPDYITDDILNSVYVILVVIPKFKFHNESQRIQSYGWGEKVQMLYEKYEDELREMSDFGQTWPSTGLVGLYSICLSYDDITIHSFDGWDKAYKYYHYFDKHERRTTENAWRENRTDHKLSAEVECVKKLIEKYNLKRLVEK